MRRYLIAKVSLCIFVMGTLFTLYLEKQNKLTRLRMQIPQLAKELRSVKEENRRLEFSIDQFESPENLMELLRSSEYCNLKHPIVDQILTIEHRDLFKRDSNPLSQNPKPQPVLIFGSTYK